MSDVVGTGWAFPISLDTRRRFALVSGVQDIEQAIQIILLTPKGQRPRRPEFGCRIHDLMFAPNTGATASLAEAYVEEALAMWEPRIIVREVSATPDPDVLARLLITIAYQIKATHDSRSLVFPFYHIPEE